MHFGQMSQKFNAYYETIKDLDESGKIDNTFILKLYVKNLFKVICGGFFKLILGFYAFKPHG
jgi:hypothetical protein